MRLLDEWLDFISRCQRAYACDECFKYRDLGLSRDDIKNVQHIFLRVNVFKVTGISFFIPLQPYPALDQG
jgi:hypothetical protein